MALKYLDLASKNKDNWNYGNAIHLANIYLGLVALEEKEVPQAKEFLLLAGKTPGSPQLNSFGPNMLYLDECKHFWMWISRIKFIKKWTSAIKNGKVPDFKAHLVYHTQFKLTQEQIDSL